MLVKDLTVTEIKQDGNLTIRAVISNEEVDRDNEVVVQSGIDTTNFLRNPVVLNKHNPFQDPIGKVIKLERVGTRTEATIQFTDENTNPEGYRIYKLYAGGYLNAFSIGFKTIKDEYRGNVRYITQSELIELSSVSIGANANAIAKALKDGAITKQEAENFIGNTQPKDSDLIRKVLTSDDECDYVKSMSNINKNEDLEAQNVELTKALNSALDTIKLLTSKLSVKTDEEEVNDDSEDTEDEVEDDPDNEETLQDVLGTDDVEEAKSIVDDIYTNKEVS